MADLHIGAWRDQLLRDANLLAFLKAVDICTEKKVDFILISGDVFNTALPSLDPLKETTKCLKELKDKKIPVYYIAGSHDYSPSGKTMLDVLERAGLIINAAKGTVNDKNELCLKFIIDPKTGAKITGLPGRRGMLDKKYYEVLDTYSLESEKGFKIFLFHTALDELKPKALADMPSSPVSLLPKSFDYYAGGHVHIVDHVSLPGYNAIVYPGPLFPNSFREIEELSTGGFYIVDHDPVLDKIKCTFEPVQVFNTFSAKIDCTGFSPEECEKKLYELIKRQEFMNTIVTLRLVGELRSGRSSDINFKEIFSAVYDKSAFFVMKSTALLTSKEFEEIKISEDGNANSDDVENALIAEHTGKNELPGFPASEESGLVKDLISALSVEKSDEEKVYDFEKRIIRDAASTFRLG